MAAHACLSALGEGGRLIVYGGNDEGIRSAGGMLEELCGSVDTLATRGHGRVLAARRPEDASAAARAAVGLAEDDARWRLAVRRARLGDLPRHLRRRPHRRGHGAAARQPAAAAGRSARARLWLRLGDHRGRCAGIAAATWRSTLIDNDTVALEAARENVPAPASWLGTRLADAGKATYAAILSNPPLHTGLSRGPRASRATGGGRAGDTSRRAESCRWWCSGVCRWIACSPMASPARQLSPRREAIACGGR